MEPSTVWSDFRRRKSVATTHLFGNSGIIAKLVFLPGLYHLTIYVWKEGKCEMLYMEGHKWLSNRVVSLSGKYCSYGCSWGGVELLLRWIG